MATRPIPYRQHMPTTSPEPESSWGHAGERRAAEEQQRAFELARAAAAEINRMGGVENHDVAVVLGTGLADAAGCLGVPEARLAFSQLPGFPPGVAAGQRPEVWSVDVGGKRVLVLRGRLHLYEGHSAARVVLPVRTALFAGCRTLVITNASGATRDGLSPGQLVLIADHLNLTGVSPLTGLEVGGGPDGQTESPTGPGPFVDLTEAWSPRLRALARKMDPSLEEGVYAQLPGPHFETPAEIRMLRTLGADLVGMSSAIELIAARHLGAEVLGISLVSNVAAGAAVGNLSEASVVEVARQSAKRLGEMLRELFLRI